MPHPSAAATVNASPGECLSAFDIIAISLSGGKDSVAMLDVVVELAETSGIRERVVALHADLGAMEWPGTTDTIRKQTAHLGIPLRVCRRMGKVAPGRGKLYAKGERFGDLLDYVERRADAVPHAPAWPAADRRFCTSEFKRSPLNAEVTALVREWRENTGERRPCRVLSTQGMRAQESNNRARLDTWSVDSRASSGSRQVTRWLPIHHWTTDQVWERIHSRGLPYHYAYDLGMSRLSCVFCVLASRSDLRIAAQHNPELLNRYRELENRVGATFQASHSLAQIRVPSATNASTQK